ncbi:MAG TPA: response regulator transcription factor [Beijerinckiaceae bacterium]|nr:response regulator transcription factor [Beijerinckiaceae bacterium]
MREHKSIGVILIGKCSLMREGISRILQAQNFRILVSASYATQLVERVRNQELLFLIVNADDDFDLVIAEIKLVKDRHPQARVAVVADHLWANEPALAFEAGASGYFVNTISCDVFIKSIELVILGETVFPPVFLAMAAPAGKGRVPKENSAANENGQAVSHIPQEDMGTPLLSPREIAILRCLAEGDSNKSIARKIGIAEATVKVHVKAILRKIRVQNRTQAAIWGMNHESLLQPANNNFLLLPQSKGALKPAADLQQV